VRLDQLSIEVCDQRTREVHAGAVLFVAGQSCFEFGSLHCLVRSERDIQLPAIIDKMRASGCAKLAVVEC
jgi:hypothetical protein